VFNATKSIALAVLQERILDNSNYTGLFSKTAIVGSITTENLGVEHLVKNVIANPYIRHLVLWGDEIEGHLPADALLNLSRMGLDKAKRIMGARGARPVLKNLTDSEAGHFRKQVKVLDLTDRREIIELAGGIEMLNEEIIKPYEAGLKVDWVEVKQAVPAKRLKLDPAGYFVIMVMKGADYPLLVEHYSNDGRLMNMVEGKDAASLCATLTEKNLVSRLDHAAYLGRELARAEMSLLIGVRYTQDKAQGKCEP